MARDVHQIRIESILGGQSKYLNFSASDQFRYSIGINPLLPPRDTTGTNDSYGASGLIRPTSSRSITNSLTVHRNPMWFINPPKTPSASATGLIYTYDAQGSVYQMYTFPDYTFTAISDGGSMSNSSGNGAAYYDNYVYFAKDTTIARYGPMDGTPAFDGNYWTTTLSKAALTAITNFPKDPSGSTIQYPYHPMLRHSDGKLYFTDITNNQGVVHYISTNKTTTEGDTDSGSTYQALTFGYNLWPTAIESYGENIAIALCEGKTVTSSNSPNSRAKIAIWNTTSQSYNLITNEEFPDQFISSLKNINGSLYVVSSSFSASDGFRVSQYVGGYSFKEIIRIQEGTLPFGGGVESSSDGILVGSYTRSVNGSPLPCVYTINPATGTVFTTVRPNNASTFGVRVSALKQLNGDQQGRPLLIGRGAGGVDVSSNGVDVSSTVDDSGDNFAQDYSQANQFWASQVYKIGQPFKITRIRIPLGDKLNANTTIIPTVYYDGGLSQALNTINSTNYGTNTQNVTIRPGNLTIDNNFWLELKFTGSSLITVSLPITIEYELLDVDTTRP